MAEGCERGGVGHGGKGCAGPIAKIGGLRGSSLFVVLSASFEQRRV